MSGAAAGEESFRRGPRSQIALLERSLRRHNYLDDDHLIEWRRGWIQRWRVDGLEQPIPRPYGFQRVRPLRGMSSFSYSSRSLFFWAGKSILAADLTRVHRLDVIGGRSLCVVFSPAPAAIVSVCWRSAEPGDGDGELAAQAGRVLAQRERRLSALTQAARAEVDISGAASIIRDATQRTASPHSQEEVEAVIWSVLGEAGPASPPWPPRPCSRSRLRSPRISLGCSNGRRS